MTNEFIYIVDVNGHEYVVRKSNIRSLICKDDKAVIYLHEPVGSSLNENKFINLDYEAFKILVKSLRSL